ncbi:hypothetical protein CC86DRAFT_98729 [Ophiobolus disseminans]|uniref:Uncharacterized protein n=1 Tax=Ophiobolus disseminans TaxID=1469910 RepID=A0A6A6ZKN6_9PLEO|nr:hypothetical protein CC86DRAFT_98729 [Ophiobolus disseminans]
MGVKCIPERPKPRITDIKRVARWQFNSPDVQSHFAASSTTSSPPNTPNYISTTLSTTSSISRSIETSTASGFLPIRVDNTKEDKSRAQGGVVAAVTLAGLCIVVTLVWLCLRRKRRSTSWRTRGR